jgi:hypothetical protein
LLARSPKAAEAIREVAAARRASTVSGSAAGAGSTENQAL